MPIKENYTHLGIIDVVDFIEDDELNISDKVGTLVQHASQDFRRHLQDIMLKNSSDIRIHAQSDSFLRH